MAESEPQQAGTVVVGVDGTPSSRAALAWAAEQARLAHAELRVVVAWELDRWSGPPKGHPGYLSPDIEARATADEAVAQVLGEAPPVPVHIDVVEASPSVALLEASTSADLLVVGSRGHGLLAGWLLGSASQHCAAYAHCPVVVVHGDHLPPTRDAETDPPGTDEMSRQECLTFLGSQRLGRLGVVVDGAPLVLPMQFVLDGDTVVLKTNAGSKVRGAPLATVTFEVDDVDWEDGVGWSVLVKGVGQEMSTALDASSERLRELEHPTWAHPPADRYLRITARSITGRRVKAHFA